MMFKFILINCLFLEISFSNLIDDIVQSTDEFIDSYHGERIPEEELSSFTRMMMRTYDFGEERILAKRSLDDFTTVTKDLKDTYKLRAVKELYTIPAKFPNDIAIFNIGGDYYAAALETNNSSSPQHDLSNDLVLYKFPSENDADQRFRRISTTQVLGGVKLAVHVIKGKTYIVVAEYYAGENHRPFEGSNLYRVVPYVNRVFLKKVQILSIIHPQDVKFIDHLDEVYMIVGTDYNEHNTSSVLIFKWLGGHFDLLQRMQAYSAKSVTPFVMESRLFLAVANYKNTQGDVKIESEIFQFSLQDNKFLSHQKITTLGALDISYFNFENDKTTVQEHFLVVANSIKKNLDGSSSSITNSVVYKNVDDQFAPFQSFQLSGARKWLSVKGTKEEFLLLAASANGINGYQYDGWRFVEVPVKLKRPGVELNIASMRYYQSSSDYFLVLSDKNSYGKDGNMFKLEFQQLDDLKNYYADLDKWCKDMKLKLSSENITAKFQDLLEKPQQPDLSHNGTLELSNMEIETVETEEFGDLNGAKVDEINSMYDNLKNLRDEIENISKIRSNDKYIEGNLRMKYLELNCSNEDSCFFENLDVAELNGEIMEDFFGNVVSIDDDIELEMMEFERIRIEHDINTGYLNGHPVETLVDRSSDITLYSDIIINGTVVIHGDLIVKGLLNGTIIDEEHVVLTHGDQTFNGKLSVRSASVDNLELSGSLNGMPLEKLIKMPEINLTDQYTNLTVHKIFVNETVSGYDVGSFMEKLGAFLKKTSEEGEDDLEIDLYADEVVIESGMLSGVNVSDILLITEGNHYKLPTGMKLLQPEVEIGNLAVTESINNVSLKEPQLTENAILTADTIIVEGVLTVEDIQSPDGKSLLNKYENGLKISETPEDADFFFDEIFVENLNVEKINNVSVDSWVLKESATQQNITGKKVFMGDLKINGNLTVKVVNGIDMEELDRDVLRKTGDQNITGKFVIDEIDCKRITANSVQLGGLDLEELFVKPRNLIINGSVVTDELDVKNLTVTGTTDSEPVDDFLQSQNEIDDTSYDDVDGGDRKSSKYSPDDEETEIFIDHLVELDTHLIVENLIFEGTLDSVSSDTFGKNWLLNEGDQVITAPFTFHNVKLKSGSKLENEIINGVNLRRLFEDTVKINESSELKVLNAINEIKTTFVDVEEKVNGRVFRDEVILKESNQTQTLLGHVVFGQNLTINGSLVVNFLSGMNATQLCELSKTNLDRVNFIVNGSVRFQEEPNVTYVNGYHLPTIMKQTWFTDKDTVLTGKAIFKNFESRNKTSLEGYLNNVNLTELSENYLSKTKSRIITADMEFDEILIRKSARIHNVTVEGLVNGIDLRKFANNILLQDVDQVITGKLEFENFRTKDLKLNGSINGLNLSKDVLRYDVDNAVVTGQKTFQDMTVDKLYLSKGSKVQDVDVPEWERLAVKREGDFRITGSLTVGDVEFRKPVTITRNVNSFPFDTQHLLTIHGNRIITGKKTFDLSKYPNNTIEIKTIKVGGLINGVNLDDLIANQAYSDRNLTFMKYVNFTNGFTAENLQVKGLYQGVSITKLCNDVMNLKNITSMDDEYEYLTSKAKEILSRKPPFFFDYFESIQKIRPKIKSVVPFSSGAEGRIYLAEFRSNRMDVLVWHEIMKKFVYDDEQSLDLVENITFVSSEVDSRNPFLYIETPNSAKIIHPNSFVNISTVETSCVASIDLKRIEKSCIFVGQTWNNSRIMCNSTTMNDLQTFQVFEKGTVEVSTLYTGNTVYLAVVEKQVIKGTIENELSILRFDENLLRFVAHQSLTEVHPVSLTSLTYQKNHFLVSASDHLPGSIQSGVVTIYRYNVSSEKWYRNQDIRVDSPIDVHLTILPSSEIALYVLTRNHEKPFIVFLHKGVQGFVEETSGLTLHAGTKLYSFTDEKDQHFVVISGFGKAEILRAGFKGSLIKSSD